WMSGLGGLPWCPDCERRPTLARSHELGTHTAKLLRSAGPLDSQSLQLLVEVAALEVQLLRRLRHMPAVSLEDAENERALVALHLRGQVERRLQSTRKPCAAGGAPGGRSCSALRRFPQTPSGAPSASPLGRLPPSLPGAPPLSP